MRVQDTDETVHFEVVDNSLESDPTRPAVRDEEIAAIKDCLAGLEPDDREVLVRHYFEDKPYAEIAEELRVRAGTVRVKAHRALRSMKKCFEAKFPESSP
jgi:RNA polymerase sigma factor (sigma-70 family)